MKIDPYSYLSPIDYINRFIDLIPPDLQPRVEMALEFYDEDLFFKLEDLQQRCECLEDFNKDLEDVNHSLNEYCDQLEVNLKDLEDVNHNLNEYCDQLEVNLKDIKEELRKVLLQQDHQRKIFETTSKQEAFDV